MWIEPYIVKYQTFYGWKFLIEYFVMVDMKGNKRERVWYKGKETEKLT